MTATFNFNYNKAYTSDVEFNTIVDEVFSGKEQRRDTWSNPKRSWTLEFSKDLVDTEEIIAFFIARKGKKEAFNWVFDSSKGGDGQTYLVRFEEDKLSLSHLSMGYHKFNLKLMQVFN